jgi:hypothetical protein
MEARFLLDTDICIYIRRKRPEEVLRRFRTLKAGEAVLSVNGKAKRGQTESAVFDAVFFFFVRPCSARAAERPLGPMN